MAHWDALWRTRHKMPGATDDQIQALLRAVAAPLTGDLEPFGKLIVIEDAGWGQRPEPHSAVVVRAVANPATLTWLYSEPKVSIIKVSNFYDTNFPP